MNDEHLQEYVFEAYVEQLIRNHEDDLLRYMKYRYEKYPSKKNDEEWLNYSNFVCRRRCQHWNMQK